MELCCTGRPVKSEEALTIGLVSQVVDADAFTGAVEAFATRLAGLPPQAISLTKRLLDASYGNSLEDQLEAEAFAQDTAGRTKDHFEGVTAFLEKRTPEFTGQ